MEKYHADSIHIMFPIIALYEPRFPSYMLVFSKYLSINVLPVASYYADNIKLCKELSENCYKIRKVDQKWLQTHTSTSVPFHIYNTQMTCAHPSKDMHLDNSLNHQEPSEVFHNNAFRNCYIYLRKFTVQHHLESTSTSYISI